MENYIESLHVKDFRLFKELNVKFNQRFNFIVGPNGCGKTSLLRAFILSYSNQNLNDSRYEENLEVWSDIVMGGSKKRLGFKHSKRQPIKKEYRENPGIQYELPLRVDGLQDVVFNFKVRDQTSYAPLILGAYRRIQYKRLDGMSREGQVNQAIQKYIDSSANSLNGGILPEVKQWMINRYFQIEKDWAKEEKINWEWLVSNIKEITPKDWQFNFSRIERDLEPIFTLNGNECYLEELSAGFQSILSIIFAIFEWIETTNPREKMLVENATGTVVIDELDVHLHPEWQLVVKDILCKMFPKLQFIVTTHSPHIIANAEPGEVIIMSKDSKNITLEPSSKSYSGWNTDNILEDIMGVSNLENKKYNQLINTALDHVENKDIAELEKTISELEKICHSNDTFAMSLKIKLAGLKLGDRNDETD